MNAQILIINYVSGRLPAVTTFWITVLILVIIFIPLEIIRRKRQKAKRQKQQESISQEIKAGSGKPDTPFVDSSFPLPQGDPTVWFLKRIRDWFIRWWYYDTLTVIRLKNEGKADHRAFRMDPLQMSTVNWDNCTYNVCRECLVPVRKQFFMVVIEGCTEPLRLWDWKAAMDLIKTYIDKTNYETWTEDDKKRFGRFDANPKTFYTKMNQRNAQLLGMTSIPNLQVMYYASLVAAFCGVILLLMAFGLIDNTYTARMDALRQGLVEIFNKVKG